MPQAAAPPQEAARTRERRGEAASLVTLGQVRQAAGDLGQALECYGKAAAISRRLADWENEARSLGDAGLLYASRGDLERALESWTAALDLFEDHGAQPMAHKARAIIATLKAARPRASHGRPRRPIA